MVKDYVNTFNKFTAFLAEDIRIGDITYKQTEAFFSVPTPVSNMALHSCDTELSSLWTEAMREHMVHHHVVRNVTPSNHEKAE
jgi:hypothetical protein